MVRAEIRHAVAADAGALSEFAAASFEATFGAATPAADMAAYLIDAFGETQQAREIADPAVVTLVAEANTLCGYAQLMMEPAPGRDDATAVKLSRFYLAPEQHGSGLAARLFDTVREEALRMGGSMLWLTVWEHNHRAIRFYQRRGCTIAGSIDFMVGNDRQVDHVMVLPLR